MVKDLNKELNSMLETKRKHDKEIEENERNFKEGKISKKEFENKRKKLLFGYSMFCTRIEETKKRLLEINQ